MQTPTRRFHLVFLLSVSCGEIVPIPGLDASNPPAPRDASQAEDAPPVLADARPLPADASAQEPDASSLDAAPCVSYDFQDIGQNLVASFPLAFATVTGSSYLAWAEGALGRRGFGVDGGPGVEIDPGEHVTVTWSTRPWQTSINWYPGTAPVRLYLEWADVPDSIVEPSASGTYAWSAESPVSIRLEPTTSQPVQLRRLSYCP